MAEQRQISICIPSYNRSDLTVDSFIGVYEDERIAEIVIVDDDSNINDFARLKYITERLPKVKLFRNSINQDCYKNKFTSVSYANFDWVILLDSDNKIDKSYLDRIFELSWDENCIYTPSFAMPHFDFRRYEGLTIATHNIATYIDKPLFETCLNACNYFVNKNRYLETWTDEIDPVTSDSIFMCKRWLEMGGEIFIVPNLYYEHRVHRGHYQENVSRTPIGFHENILQSLKNMV